MELKDDDLYAVKICSSYMYIGNDGNCRGSKRSGSIISGKKLKKLPFNVSMAIDSGLLILEKIED